MADARVEVSIVPGDTTQLERVLAAIGKHALALADELGQIRAEHQRWDDEGGPQPRT